jgi:hypothetical protein
MGNYKGDIMGKWIFAIFIMILIWVLGGVVFSIILSNSSLEPYGGLFSFTTGIIVMIMIIRNKGRVYNEVERLQGEITKTKQRIVNQEKALKYYESQLERVKSTQIND